MKIRVKSFFVMITTIVAILGCQHRRASKMLEAGLYADAMAAYEQMLIEDPSDTDARIGLAKARSEYARQELINIRLLRIGGNDQAALDRLEAYLRKTKDWDLGGYTSATIGAANEELEYESAFLVKMLKGKLDTIKPLQADMLMNHYSFLLSAKQNFEISRKMTAQIYEAGQKQCQEFKRYIGEESISYAKLLAAYCSHYGIQVNLEKVKPKNDYRFAKIALGGSIASDSSKSLQPEYIASLEAFLNDNLQTSPLYYSASPNVMTMSVSGNFTYTYAKERIVKTHAYIEEVPYNAYEQYTEIQNETIYEAVLKDEPYNECHYDSTVKNNVCTTKMRQVSVQQPKTVQKSVPKTRLVTKIRQEERAYRYPATEHKEYVRLNIKVVADYLSGSVAALNKDETNNFTTHDEDRPKIGLKKSEEKFISHPTWLSKRFSEISRSMIERINKAAKSKYCEVRNDLENSVYVEAISRCAEFDANNAVVSSWYNATFGMDRSAVVDFLESKK